MARRTLVVRVNWPTWGFLTLHVQFSYAAKPCHVLTSVRLLECRSMIKNAWFINAPSVFYSNRASRADHRMSSEWPKEEAFRYRSLALSTTRIAKRDNDDALIGMDWPARPPGYF